VTVLGHRANFTDPQGRRVQALCYDERANLPVYCIEILDSNHKVVEYIEAVFGHSGLMDMARRRGWVAE
jgi:hypothetical protein